MKSDYRSMLFLVLLFLTLCLNTFGEPRWKCVNANFDFPPFNLFYLTSDSAWDYGVSVYDPVEDDIAIIFHHSLNENYYFSSISIFFSSL